MEPTSNTRQLSLDSSRCSGQQQLFVVVVCCSPRAASTSLHPSIHSFWACVGHCLLLALPSSTHPTHTYSLQDEHSVPAASSSRRSGWARRHHHRIDELGLDAAGRLEQHRRPARVVLVAAARKLLRWRPHAHRRSRCCVNHCPSCRGGRRARRAGVEAAAASGAATATASRASSRRGHAAHGHVAPRRGARPASVPRAPSVRRGG